MLRAILPLHQSVGKGLHGIVAIHLMMLMDFGSHHHVMGLHLRGILLLMSLLHIDHLYVVTPMLHCLLLLKLLFLNRQLSLMYLTHGFKLVGVIA
jgi:hypothetical protein